MTPHQILDDLRRLAEKAKHNGLKNEARMLFGFELVLEQSIKNNLQESPEPWANAKDIQDYITNRHLHTEPSVKE
jgi:hypothetical protein